MLLRGEPGSLNFRVVQFSVGVGNLHARGEGLEPLDVSRLVGVSLGQGRHVLGVIDQEGWLNQIRLDVHGQHLVDETTPGLSGSGFQTQFAALSGERFGVGVVFNVNAAPPSQFLAQRQSRPRWREVDHFVSHRDLHRTMHILGQR